MSVIAVRNLFFLANRKLEPKDTTDTQQIGMMCTCVIVIKDEQIGINGLYFMTMKFSSRLDQHQGAEDTNRAYPSWGL